MGRRASVRLNTHEDRAILHVKLWHERKAKMSNNIGIQLVAQALAAVRAAAVAQATERQAALGARAAQTAAHTP